MTFATFERRDDIGIVTIDRPERLNAMSTALLNDVHGALDRANRDEAVKVIVYTGAGRAFCAGDDLKEFDRQSANAAAIRTHVEAIQRVSRDLMFTDKIVIGAVHGYAVGGGFEWLLNCDMVVAADDLVAFFPEMDWAQFVTGGVTYLLPRALGHQRAIELMVLGEQQGAADLVRLGLVNRVVKRAAMMETAMEVARKVAAKSSFSVGRLKRVLTEGPGGPLDRALAAEQDITIEAFARPEAAERVKRFDRQ